MGYYLRESFENNLIMLILSCTVYLVLYNLDGGLGSTLGDVDRVFDKFETILWQNGNFWLEVSGRGIGKL